MRMERLAAQLYTVRAHTQTPADLLASLKKIRGIGYRAVQVSGVGPIREEDLLEMLEGEGLTCCVTHEPGERILAEPERVAERLRKLKCAFTAYPIPAGVRLDTPYPGRGLLETQADVERLAEGLDRSGEVLRRAGVTLTYHNHAVEFRRFDGRRTMLESIYALTRPENLQAELDTYWVQAGGADPVAWCRRLKGRLPLLHLKDYAIGPDFRPAFAEVGYGNLDFPAIVEAAEDSSCQWFIVEQDVCPGDPFESLEKSYRWVSENLVK